MALPRILSIGPDGFLRQHSAVEFETLRGAPLNEAAIEVPAGPAVALDRISDDCLELRADLVLGSVRAGV